MPNSGDLFALKLSPSALIWLAQGAQTGKSSKPAYALCSSFISLFICHVNGKMQFRHPGKTVIFLLSDGDCFLSHCRAQWNQLTAKTVKYVQRNWFSKLEEVCSYTKGKGTFFGLTISISCDTFSLDLDLNGAGMYELTGAAFFWTKSFCIITEHWHSAGVSEEPCSLSQTPHFSQSLPSHRSCSYPLSRHLLFSPSPC